MTPAHAKQKFLEAKIKQRIHEFDFISLLRLLLHLGRSMDEILFKSNVSISSQTALFHDIEFQNHPSPQVRIWVNLGLMSAQNFLPSYFQKNLDHGDMETNAFLDFLGYFDHYMIFQFFLNLYPELNTRLIPDWSLTQKRYIQMMDLTSKKTLFFLFRAVFPELSLLVEKIMLTQVVETRFPRLGYTILGDDAVFGSEVKIPVYGVRVTLFTEEEFYGNQTPWPVTIKTRLEALLFPLLTLADIHLEILLVIRSQKSWAKLKKESYLGYEHIRGGVAQFRRIRIFRGHLTTAIKTKQGTNI